MLIFCTGGSKAIPHNSRLTAQAPLRRLRHGICVAKMLDNVGLRYPHRASGAKAPRTLRPLPLLRFAVSATGGAHLCSIQYSLRFWLGICRTSLAVSALRIMRYCLSDSNNSKMRKRKLYRSMGAVLAFSQVFSSSVRRGLSISYTWAWYAFSQLIWSRVSSSTMTGSVEMGTRVSGSNFSQ